jgi:ABC-type transporter MlaC component
VTNPTTAADIAANVVRKRCGFSPDQVSKLNPQKLGEYIAYMIGTQDDLESFAAFVDVLKGYNKADGEAFQGAFSQTLEQRYMTTPTTAADIAAEDEEEARRDYQIYLADYDDEETDAAKQAREARRDYEVDCEETHR